MYTGQKVRLREYRKEDISTRLSYINDPEIVKCLVSETPYQVTLSEEEKWFESISVFKDTYRFAIETLREKKYIGDCSINRYVPCKVRRYLYGSTIVKKLPDNRQ